jgi:hypothetical protein
MASKADEGSKAPRERISAKSTADPILRNALRYTISAKEYETLHKYIISRSKVLKRNAPSPAKVEKLVERPGRDDYNAAAVRDSLRVFLATAAGLKAWAVIKEQFLGGEQIRYRFLPDESLNWFLTFDVMVGGREPRFGGMRICDCRFRFRLFSCYTGFYSGSLRV